VHVGALVSASAHALAPRSARARRMNEHDCIDCGMSVRIVSQHQFHVQCARRSVNGLARVFASSRSVSFDGILLDFAK